MPLGTTEQIIYDYLTNNPEIRDFWMNQISGLKAQGFDDEAIVEEIVNRFTQVYWSHQEGWADIEGLVNRISLFRADYKSVAYMLLGRDINKEALDTVINTQSVPARNEGTKDNPIPIISASALGADMHSVSAIDRLFGGVKWTELSNHGDINGIYCLEITLENGKRESVWFDYSPAAKLIKRRAAGEKVSVLDTMSPQEQKDFKNAVAKAKAEAQSIQEIKRELKEGPRKKKADVTATGCVSGCLLLLVILFGIYFVIVSDSMLVRATIVIGGWIFLIIVGAISNKIDKRRKEKEVPPLTAKEQIEQKVDVAFTEYKKHNPDGKLSRDYIRQDWLKRNGFDESI